MYNRFSAVFAFQSTPSAWRETEIPADWNCHEIISIHSLRMEGDDGRSPVLRLDFDPISIHSLRMEGDVVSSPNTPYIFSFQSTPSAWRETCRATAKDVDHSKFQSTPSAWRETSMVWRNPLTRRHFNPLPPHGGRHVERKGENPFDLFQSTPSAWRETRCRSECFAAYSYFNPLPPHGGRRLNRRLSLFSRRNFNPLPPHGGRLSVRHIITNFLCYFNPLPPHGGRP